MLLTIRSRNVSCFGSDAYQIIAKRIEYLNSVLHFSIAIISIDLSRSCFYTGETKFYALRFMHGSNEDSRMNSFQTRST